MDTALLLAQVVAQLMCATQHVAWLLCRGAAGCAPLDVHSEVALLHAKSLLGSGFALGALLTLASLLALAYVAISQIPPAACDTWVRVYSRVAAVRCWLRYASGVALCVRVADRFLCLTTGRRAAEQRGGNSGNAETNTQGYKRIAARFTRRHHYHR